MGEEGKEEAAVREGWVAARGAAEEKEEAKEKGGALGETAVEVGMRYRH